MASNSVILNPASLEVEKELNSHVREETRREEVQEVPPPRPNAQAQVQIEEREEVDRRDRGWAWVVALGESNKFTVISMAFDNFFFCSYLLHESNI